MMMNTHFLSLRSFLSILLLVGCTEVYVEETLPEQQAPQIESIEISTDKETYSSNELMRVQVIVNSVSESKNLQLAFSGLRTGDRDIIYDVIPVNLTIGRNLIMYGYKLPECNTCNGIAPGKYMIYADLYYGRNIANVSKEITLK